MLFIIRHIPTALLTLALHLLSRETAAWPGTQRVISRAAAHDWADLGNTHEMGEEIQFQRTTRTRGEYLTGYLFMVLFFTHSPFCVDEVNEGF